MKIDKTETFGTITLSANDVGLVIRACILAIRADGDDATNKEYVALQNEFKALFKRMTGTEFGVR